MTDKELLELAAKAGGIPGKYIRMDDGHNPLQVGIGDLTEGWWWNALDDDGDALRLAVKLNMGISIHDNYCTACAQTGKMQTERDTGTTAEVTRRAIVRAAADIAKAM